MHAFQYQEFKPLSHTHGFSEMEIFLSVLLQFAIGESFQTFEGLEVKIEKYKKENFRNDSMIAAARFSPKDTSKSITRHERGISHSKVG